MAGEQPLEIRGQVVLTDGRWAVIGEALRDAAEFRRDFRWCADCRGLGFECAVHSSDLARAANYDRVYEELSMLARIPA